MSDYILGIDIGPTSCSAVGVSVDKNQQPVGILVERTQIFSPPYKKEKSRFISKTAERRLARHQRRQIDRKIYRKKNFVKFLEINGITNSKEMESVICSPQLRAKAAEEQITLPELGVVLLKIAKRRGYKGSLYNIEGKVALENKELNTQLKMLKIPDPTIGQLLYSFQKRGLSTRLKHHGLSALRVQYEYEVQRILEVQSEYYPKLKLLSNKIVDFIFFQQPLKNTEVLVGQCSIDVRHRRAHIASPKYQSFRIYEQVNNLRWVLADKRKVPLTLDQRNAIIDLLNNPKYLDEEGKITYLSIREHLQKIGLNKDFDGKFFSRECSKQSKIKGNVTKLAFFHLNLSSLWENLTLNNQNRILKLLSDDGFSKIAISSENAVFYLEETSPYASLFSRNPLEYKSLVDFINQLISVKPNPNLRNCGLESGRSSYCLKTLKGLTNYLAINVDETERHAEAFLKYQYFEASLNISNENILQDWQELKNGITTDLLTYVDNLVSLNKKKWTSFKEYPLPIKTGNPIIDRALRQSAYVIKSILDKHGKPLRIHIETTRDLSFGPKKRTEWEQKQLNNEKRNNDIRLQLIELNELTTPINIKRMKLWQEQNFNCPYCNNPITYEQALNGNQTNFEHIQPKCESGIGLRMHEIVLAHRSCNELKGDRWPIIAFRGDSQRQKALENIIKHFQSNKKDWYSKHKAGLLSNEPLEDRLVTEIIDDSVKWADASMQSTAWIARVLNQWLQPSKIPLFFTTGIFTSILRSSWELDDVIPSVRFKENRVVWKVDLNEKKPISEEEFIAHRNAKAISKTNQKLKDRDHQKKILRIDKRVDHRHHTIDALVIALCSPGLLKAYRKASLFKSRFKPELPYEDLWKDAKALIENCNLQHTPDRHPPKQFFKDSPRSIVGDYLAKNKSIRLFAEAKDINSLKNLLDRIVSESTRDLFFQHIARRSSQLNLTLDPATGLPENIKKEDLVNLFKFDGIGDTPFFAVIDPRYGSEKLIKKVKCYCYTGINKVKATSAFKINVNKQEKEHQHALQIEGNACLLLNHKEINKSKVLTNIEYCSLSSSEKKNVTFIFSGDTIINENRKLLVRQLSSAHNNLILTDIVEASSMKVLEKLKIGSSASARVSIGKKKFKELI